MWIWVSSLPGFVQAFVLEASLAGRGNPSRRFLDGGGEPANEEGSSEGGRAPVVVRGREFRAAELDMAAVDRMEKEF